MDFGIEEPPGLSFVYVLPFGADRALVESTAFSRGAVPAKEHRRRVERYLERVYETVAPRQIDRGGPVVLVQIENSRSVARVALRTICTIRSFSNRLKLIKRLSFRYARSSSGVS